MNIFNVILNNFSKKSRTRKPADVVPCPQDFRGELIHNLESCTLCGTCAYVCSPGAITQTHGESDGRWMYNAGQCTFCGRCVEYCPTKALSFLQHPVAVYAHTDDAKTSHWVEYQKCTRCGAPILPLPIETLVRLYHSEDAARQAQDIHLLCERCRGRVHSERMKSGLTGKVN